MNDAQRAPPVIELPEYSGNPFIAKLPPPRSQREFAEALAARPAFDPRERDYPAHIRKHCVARLMRYFEPLSQSMWLAERIDLLLRQGYVGRNPRTHAYLARLQNGAERIAAGTIDVAASHPVENTAAGFTLLGHPGMSKTTSTRRALALYPQLITHHEPFSLIQIVWLRLEAPSQGSVKQLCVSFFAEVDRLIGTDYLRRYGASRSSVERMLVHMAQVVELHALGVLVIDEIQHLKRSAIGTTALLKFLVTLVNTIGVPVVLVGTLGALDLLRGSFSEARRATGVGSMIWERFAPGKAWNHFVERLWAYQWTREMAPLTDEIRAVLYDESQGVIDLVVKLFLLAQLRLLSVAELKPRAPELLTATLLHRLATEEFRIVRPMIEALRTNDVEKLAEIDDLQPLEDRVNRMLTEALQSTAAPYLVPESPATGKASTASIEETIRRSLAECGVAHDVAGILIKQVLAENPSDDPLTLVSKIAAKLAATPVRLKKPKLKLQAPTEMPSEDLRRICAEGKAAGKDGYGSLIEAGVIRSPVVDFAA